MRRLWAILCIAVLLAAGLVFVWKPYRSPLSQPLSSLSVEVEEGEVHVGAPGEDLRLVDGDLAQLLGERWALRQPEAPPPMPLATRPTLPGRIPPRIPLALFSQAWTVQGEVVDAAGLAVAGASVFVATLAERARSGGGAELSLARSVLANRAGGYRLGFRGLEGTVVLGASREGYVPAYVPLALEGDGGRLQYRLVLQPGAALAGLVTENLTGRPIAGARVRVRDAQEDVPGLRYARGIPQEVCSDASGEFHLSTVSPLGLFTLEVFAPDYLPRRENGKKLSDCPIHLVLNRGGRVAGVVVEKDTGRPVPGAQVYAMNDWRIAEQSESDGAGRFTLEGLSPGTYRLLARKGEWINWFYADSEELADLQPPRVEVRIRVYPDPVTLTLVRGVTVSGQVRNRLSGAPVEGAALRLLGGAISAPYADARSDREGRYRMAGLYPGRFSLLVTAQGYAHVAPWGDLRANSHFARFVVSGQEDVAGVDFALDPQQTIAGRVFDEQGQGVEGVPMAVQFEEAARNAPDRRSYSGARGEFVIDGLYGGHSLRVVALPRLRAPVYSEPLFLPPGENVEGVELILRPAGSVSGHVRTASGEAAEGAMVEYRLLEGDTTVLDTGRARTNAQGYYEFSSVPEGTIRVSLGRSLRRDGEGATLTSQTFALGPGEERGGVDFVVDGAPGGRGSISGRVVDGDGRPVVGAVVAARAETGAGGHAPPAVSAWGHAEQGTWTRGDGRFDLNGLLEERYRLTVYHRDFQLARVAGVQVGADDLQIALSPAPSLVGRVVGEDGRPVPSYQLRVITLSLAEQDVGSPIVGGYEIHQQPEGRFAIPINRAGQYRVEVDVEDGRRGASEPLTVQDQDTPETTIVVEQKYALRGRVTDQDTHPVAGAKVAVFSLNRLQLQRRFFFVPLFLGWRGVATTDAEGDFKITGLPDPVDSVWVFHPNYAVQYLPNVDIQETRRRPLAVRLDVGATLALAVEGPQHARLPQMRLRVRFPAQSDAWQEYSTGRDGALVLPHCPPGPAMVELIDAPDWASHAQWQGELPSGERVEVTLGAS